MRSRRDARRRLKYNTALGLTALTTFTISWATRSLVSLSIRGIWSPIPATGKNIGSLDVISRVVDLVVLVVVVVKRIVELAVLVLMVVVKVMVEVVLDVLVVMVSPKYWQLLHPRPTMACTHNKWNRLNKFCHQTF